MIKVRIPKALPGANRVIMEIEALNRAWQVERANEPGFHLVMAPRRLELTPGLLGKTLEWGADLLDLIRVSGYVEEFNSGRLVLVAEMPEGGEATFHEMPRPDHRPQPAPDWPLNDLSRRFSHRPYQEEADQ